jgi:hypothetical protein
MEKEEKSKFQICPSCHIGYDINNINFFNHILKCNGRPDIITTRFYTKKQFYKLKSPQPIVIEPYERPVTR